MGTVVPFRPRAQEPITLPRPRPPEIFTPSEFARGALVLNFVIVGFVLHWWFA